MKQRPAQSARYVLLAALAVWFVLPAVPQGGYTESGLASWYGYPYHGRSSASGEVYDMEGLTAAHQTLPFNTLVRVVNLENDMSVQVRITDRGPFVDGRIIDLSRAAARSIGVIEPGTARVRLEVIGTRIADSRPPAPAPVVSRPALPARAVVVPAAFTPAPAPPPDPSGTFAVQTGAFRNSGNAQRYCGLMKSRYGSARLVLPEEGDQVWRVLVGSLTTRDDADALTARIRRDSGENNAFVVRLDSSNEPDRPGQSPRPRWAVAADGLHTPPD
jgi:rare lipoprotein A